MALVPLDVNMNSGLEAMHRQSLLESFSPVPQVFGGDAGLLPSVY